MIGIVQRSPTIAVARAMGHKVSPISFHFAISTETLSLPLQLESSQAQVRNHGESGEALSCDAKWYPSFYHFSLSFS
jgi:hypothetical protein